MTSPQNFFQTWEDATIQFIESARKKNSDAIPFSTLHIIVNALNNLPSEQIYDNPLRKLMDENQLIECFASIRVQLAFYKENPAGMQTTIITEKTFVEWNTEAQKRSVKVTIPFIIWYILMHDKVIWTCFHELTDVDLLIRMLEHRFSQISGVFYPPVKTDSVEMSSYIESVANIILPSDERPNNFEKKLLYAEMHAILMSNILTVLNKLEKNRIAVLTGMFGTPINNIGDTLADVLKKGSLQLNYTSRLLGYSKVYQLDMIGLLNLSTRGANPFAVLQEVFAEAEKDNAILLIKNLQILAKQTNAQQYIATMENSGRLVLGLFEAGAHSNDNPNEIFDTDTIDVILARSYTDGQTKALITEHYLPQWQNLTSYTFTPDAFDTIIALEPGAWIETRRKTLPYLAVGLGEDTIQTAQGGKSLIAETAQSALDTLKNLRDEAAVAERIPRAKYQPILDEAQQDIEALLKDPLPKRNANGKYILTRAHVTAQLICPNNSEFHYPGIPPEQYLSRKIDLPSV